MPGRRRLVGEDAGLDRRLAHQRNAFGQRQIGDLTVRRIQDERVAAQLQAQHQADRPRERLRGDACAGRGVLLDERHRLRPHRVAGVAGQHRERHRQTVVEGRVEHPPQHGLVAARGDVRHELDQAPAAVGHARDDRGDLLLRGVVGGDRLAAEGLVEREPRRREPQRAGLDGLGGQPPHPVEVLGRRGFARGAALAHHVDPQRRVRQVGGHVDVAGACVEGVEVLRERLPVPRQPVGHHDAGDVLDAGHHVDEHVVVGPPARGEADAAVAHHRGRDAVRRRRCHAVRPDGLTVVVGVQVDEPGGDEQPCRIDLAGAGAVDAPDRGNPAVGDRDVADERFTSAAVDHGAVADDQVVAAHAATLRP